MTDPYDDLLKSPSPATGGAVGGDPYGDLLGVSAQKFKASTTLAVDANPDEFAKQRQIAKQLNTPVAAVEALPQDAARSAKVQAIDKDTAAAPVLRKRYTDADFAKLAHDDSGVLSGIESLLGGLGKAASYLASADDNASLVRDVKAGVFGANSSAAGLFRASTELAAPLLDALEYAPSIGGNPIRRLSEGFALIAQSSAAAQKESASKTEGNIAGGASSGVQSLTQNLLMLPAALLTGGESAVLAWMSAMAGGTSYEKSREAGKGVYQSLAYGASDAVIEFATERIPMRRLIGDLKAGAGLFKTLVTNAALEVPGEQIATVLQDANEWAALHPEKSMGDYLRERPDAAVQTLIATLVGTGGQVTLMHAIQQAVNNATGQADQAQQAESFGEQITRLFAASAESKLRARDPESFAATVQQMADETGGAPSSVFIDARTLGEVLNQSGIDEAVIEQLAPGLAAQRQEAEVSGGSVEIPIGTLAAVAPGTPLEELIAPHLRATAESLSLAEAQEAGVQAETLVKADATRIMTEAQVAAEQQDSADRVQQTILDQLNTLGRNTADVNANYAAMVKAFYATTSARLGVTPEELYQRFPLRVTGETAGAVLEQGSARFTEDNRPEQIKSATGNSGQFDPTNPSILAQETRGTYNPATLTISLLEAADLSTFLHESGHAYLEILSDIASQPNAPADIVEDFGKVLKWFGIKGDEAAGGEDAGGELQQSAAPVPSVVQATFERAGGSGDIDESTDIRAKSLAFAEMAKAEGFTVSDPGDKYFAIEKNLGKDPDGYDRIAILNVRVSDHSNVNRGVHFGGSEINIAPDDGYPRDTFASALWKMRSVDVNEDLDTLIDGRNKDEFVFAQGGEQPAPSAPPKLKRTPQETWRTMTLEQKRPYHERWAQSFEQYLLIGKAPSLELRGPFQRFRGWMLQVYKSLKNFTTGFNTKLSAEVRQVFDRLLATQDQIAEAEQQARYEAIYKSAEEAGMDENEWAVYQEMHKEGSDAAIDAMQAKSLSDMKWTAEARSKALRKAQADVKALRDAMREEVTAEVNASPLEQAREYIKTQRQSTPEQKAALAEWTAQRKAALEQALADGKAALAAENPEAKGIAKGQLFAKAKKTLANQAEAKALEWEAANPKPVAALPDVQMDQIAEQFGFSSGDELARTMTEQPQAKDLIEAETERRLLEAYGELVTPAGIEQAANEAIHNEARGRFVATELATLQKAMSQTQQVGVSATGRPVSVNVMVQAAKSFAESIVARTKILDLKPSRYTAAETRAAAAVQKAMLAGKTAEAVAAQRDRLLNLYAARETMAAQAEAKKALDYLKKFDRDTIRAKIPKDYLDQIDSVLEGFDLRASTGRTAIQRAEALQAWVKSQNELGIDPILPDEVLARMGQTSYKTLTMEEFRGMVDTVKQIEHLGRLKGRLLAAKDKRDFDVIANEIAQSIRDNGGAVLPVKLEPDGWIKKTGAAFWADHRKLNSLIRQMDGGKDNGPFYRALIRSMNDAGTKEAAMTEQATEALAKIYAPVLALKGGVSGDVKFIPEINASLSRAGRLSIALNWGNEQNQQRVMSGDGWSYQQAQAIIKTLSPVELQFVNDVWSYIDSFWPEIKAKQERVTGVAEEKVEAVPFDQIASDGSVVKMRGGYYPIKYDSDRSMKAEKNEAVERAAEIMRGAVARPTTRRGHTKARVEEVKGRPIRKDLAAITQHVNQVVHDLSWHEWVIDANRLLNDSRINAAVREHYGNDAARTMREAADAIAVGDAIHQHAADRILLMLRSNVTRSVMGASLTTALLQPFGLTQSMARIGALPALRGAGRWAGDAVRMESTVGWIQEKSEFMRLRNKTFNRELREISQRVEGKSKTMQVVDASLFMLMQKMQLIADVPTWVGQYEKALAGGTDESTAIALADEAVLASQGGGTIKDMSAIQRNMPFLTQFYSYFNTTMNLVVEKTGTTDFKNPKAVAGWLSDMALLTIIPAILPALVTHLLKGGGEDDDAEEWAKRIAGWQASYTLGMMVGFRELPAIWSPFDYQGPPAGKIVNDAKKLAQQSAQGEVDEPLVLAAINFMGTSLGIPTVQLLRSYKGWKAWSEGDAPATSILFGPPPKN